MNYLYSPYGNSIADTIPDAVKDDYLYKLYIKETENISNCYGIYGMLQELCSAALDLRVKNIYASIKYKEKSLSADDIKSYYFWKGYLMHYLDMLENRYPNTYESLMNHPDFVELIYDTFSYMEKQIDTAPVIVASARKEAAPYVEWYLMEDSQEQWCKIKTITEEKISNVKNFAVSYLTLYQLFVSKTS